MNIKQIKIAVVNWVFCQSFRVRTFFKIQEYPSVDDSEGKKRVHGVWTAWFIVEWFTVADLLYPWSNGYHHRPKSTPATSTRTVELRFLKHGCLLSANTILLQKMQRVSIFLTGCILYDMISNFLDLLYF